MPKYLSEQDYNNLMTDRKAGNIDIEISKEVARQFFTHLSRHNIEQKIGRSVTLKKLLILLFALAAPAVFACYMYSVYAHYDATAASFIIPASGIFWIVVYGFTSNQGGWLIGTIPLVAAALLVFTTELKLAEPLTLLLLSLWLQRSTYLLATFWLKDIISQSYAAFEELVEHIQIISTP